MKIKRIGTVYPSPSSSSSSTKDATTIMKLLPATIFALAISLPTQDREVLAYMITRSMISTNPSSSSTMEHQKAKKCKKQPTNVQKELLFECGCFDCYTSYWFRWDSSPNREVIHKAIEAFEDHLAHKELPNRNGRGRKRDKVAGRNGIEKSVCDLGKEAGMSTEVPVPESDVMGKDEVSEDVMENGEDECEDEVVDVVSTGNVEETKVTVRQPAASYHKGLARKVLPDVVGLLNSRLWSLWSPNV